MNRKEIDQWLTETAYAIANHLKSVGCVRKADNVEPDTMTVDEICQQFDLNRALWKAVKEKAAELDIPLVYGYFNGYYIGKSGEQARTVVAAGEIMRGLAQNIRDQFFYLGKNGTLEEAKTYARATFGRDLHSFPKMLEAHNVRLPNEVIAFLESGE